LKWIENQRRLQEWKRFQKNVSAMNKIFDDANNMEKTEWDKRMTI
jgi:hypothetical protein